jgi:prolyl-tRNA editing enzyme YbaK/EbsC (Cys-tRNA(Pro) deacylase)
VSDAQLHAPPAYVRLLHSAETHTVAQSAAALGIPEARVLKSIVLSVGGSFVLALAAGTRPIQLRLVAEHLLVSRSAVRLATPVGALYSDEKVANRDTKVWHGATEKGP